MPLRNCSLTHCLDVSTVADLCFIWPICSYTLLVCVWVNVPDALAATLFRLFSSVITSDVSCTPVVKLHVWLAEQLSVLLQLFKMKPVLVLASSADVPLWWYKLALQTATHIAKCWQVFVVKVTPMIHMPARIHCRATASIQNFS